MVLFSTTSPPCSTKSHHYRSEVDLKGEMTGSDDVLKSWREKEGKELGERKIRFDHEMRGREGIFDSTFVFLHSLCLF